MIIFVLKNGEYDKLPRPEGYGGQNLLDYYNIPKDAKFTYVNHINAAKDHTVVSYNGKEFQIRSERLIEVHELREEKLNKILE